MPREKASQTKLGELNLSQLVEFGRASAMKVEDDRKLNFNDVLVRPRPSSLSSRRDVDITRTFKFPHSLATWTGFPIVASNMDTTGTIRMAKALAKHEALTGLSKYYKKSQLIDFFRAKEGNYAFYSMGITDADLEKLRAVRRKISLTKVSIEVANGYISDLPKFVQQVRREGAVASCVGIG